MHPPISVLIILALSCAASAVFFTKASDNDYPRIGRSNFFTSGNGNHYPRIGRRETSRAQILLPGLEFNDLAMADKRGVFTQGPHGSYPRVGRTSGGRRRGDDYASERKEMSENLEGERVYEIEGNNVGHGGVIDSWHSSVPLEIMFELFDSDSDGKLSKEEFVSGLSRYPQHRSLY
uniref:Pleurin 2 n=1 Tax=Deroceras reticulatum TaxID=145610 RepID=A0A1X9WEG0_DERRE|nr:pleurin2 [Deroceras reticulatum]QRC76234.1 pleurin 2 [Deroceras reticulatum]